MTESVASQTPTRSTGRTLGLVIGVLLLLGLVAVFAWGLQTRESTQLQGASAPDLQMPLFGGGEISLADLRGQVVVINFWASWCVECYKEAALLEEAYRDYKDRGVVFLGVDYLDTEKDALEYIARYDITYPNGPDIQSKIARAYQITGVPETFFIDKNGRIRHVQIGPIERAQLYSLLETLAGELQ